MSDESQPISIKDFSASFKGFLDQVTREAPTEEPFFAKKLREHFGQDPALLPTLSESFATTDHANVQLAFDAYFTQEGRSFELLGMITEHPMYGGGTFANLIAAPGRGLTYGSGIAQGPVEYVNLPSGDEELLACVQRGIYFVSGAAPMAVLLRGPDNFGMHRVVTVEVMSSDKARSEEFLAAVRKSLRTRNIYRGRIVSLSWEDALRIAFHRLPQIERDAIILPEGLLERVERHTIGFSRVAEKLRAASRHLKRGLLLHGAPGTGKTLTAMYLAGQSPDRTVILLTGRSLGLIEQSCAMARTLQPATVIIEDVDLIAEERTHQGAACNAVLFELLNAMDGLAEDADVLFVLTTNRPDILEPALASRPGRIDQAVEVPLPDAGCRRRLFDLYGRGLTMAIADLELFVRRTEGASAAFIRELLRRAALIAAEESGPISVKDRHVDEALHELVIAGGELTKSLLGARLES
jgi:ATPase family protein associated with various cellular activities (AAA)